MEDSKDLPLEAVLPDSNTKKLQQKRVSENNNQIQILNEKRESSSTREATRKLRHVARVKPDSAESKQKAARSKADHAKEPRLDLYEVYFDKGEQNSNKLSQKTKTNIQKIKFKRRSPSVESF